MNLKSKLVGISTASVLALGMTSGVLAQNWNNGDHDDQGESESVGVSVNLVDGVCSFDLSANDLNFGDLTWDGLTWVTPDDQALTLTVTDGHRGDDCTVNATSAGLFNRGRGQENNTDGVSTESFNGNRGDRIGVTIDGTELGWEPTNVYDGASGEVGLAVGLNTSNSRLDAGHYRGEINFQLGRGR